MSSLEAMLRPLKDILGSRGRDFGRLGVVLEVVLDVLEASGSLLRASRAVFQGSWRRLETSWRPLGEDLGGLGRSWRRSCASWTPHEGQGDRIG